jgi:hypothetical protein
MSAFTDETTETLQVENLSVLIRKLSGTSLRKARKVRQGIDIQSTGKLPPELFRVLREGAAAQAAQAGPKPVPTLEEQQEARYALYDCDDMLVRGIQEWSSPRTIEEGAEQLSDSAQELIFHRIVDLAHGPIDPAKVAEGKG